MFYQTLSIMKKRILFSLIALSILIGCGGNREKSDDQEHATNQVQSDAAFYDIHRGSGKWTAEKLNLNDNINEAMAVEGERITNEKCSACHKPNEDTKVGPGWKGVTSRRSAEWIMNFITNPEGMIDVDPKLKALWEQCNVRMPDLNLTDFQARQILEYLRKNDKS